MNQDQRPSIKTIKSQLGMTVIFVLIGFLSAALLAFPTKWLWNWLVPELFNGHVISVIQAWGLSMLSYLMIPRGVVKFETPKSQNNPK